MQLIAGFRAFLRYPGGFHPPAPYFYRKGLQNCTHTIKIKHERRIKNRKFSKTPKNIKSSLYPG